MLDFYEDPRVHYAPPEEYWQKLHERPHVPYDPRPICCNGNAHAKLTDDKEAVTCSTCLDKLKGESSK